MNTSPAELPDLRPRRQILDRLFRGSTLAAGGADPGHPGADRLDGDQQVAARVPVRKASASSPSDAGRPANDVYGALSFIYGTGVTALIAVVISVPVSLGIALFTTQVAPAWLKKWLVSLTDLVAVVPSVVFGLWGIIFLAPKLAGVYKNDQRLVRRLAGARPHLRPRPVPAARS